MRRAVCLLLVVGFGCSNREESRPNPALKVPDVPAGRSPDGKGVAPVKPKRG